MSPPNINSHSIFPAVQRCLVVLGNKPRRKIGYHEVLIRLHTRNFATRASVGHVAENEERKQVLTTILLTLKFFFSRKRLLPSLPASGSPLKGRESGEIINRTRSTTRNLRALVPILARKILFVYDQTSLCKASYKPSDLSIQAGRNKKNLAIVLSKTNCGAHAE